MTDFDLTNPPWSVEAGGTGNSDDWGDEQDRSEWFKAAANYWAARATAPVHIAIWDDSGAMNAQAYRTRDAAERDFPGAGQAPSMVTIIESTVQV